MKQIVQDLNHGATQVVTVPVPQCGAGRVLIKAHCSLISAGTERMLVEFGKANWLNKARQQPDKVRQVIEKAKTDGILATLDSVQSKLDQPLPLGYCHVGEVIEVGEGITEFHVGDRVISNGCHADIVSVPKHLCAKIPDNVDDETAVFTVIGAIALQGVRLAQPTLGETFAVIGLGLIGLITAQLLQTNGCTVIGMDFSEEKLALARQLGIHTLDLAAGSDPAAFAQYFTDHQGVDGALITASTQSNDPVHQAAQMCRKRGRIVLVGVTGLTLSRADFYAKELSFQVSCSYGPGRYDTNYEEKGQDYPIGFVRWTEQRNFSAILALMAAQKINIQSFITHRFPIDHAEKAYETLANDSSAIGIVLQYPNALSSKNMASAKTIFFSAQNQANAQDTVVTGFIGAGNYAVRTLIPAFKKAEVQLNTVISARGLSAQYAAKKFGFAIASTETDALFNDPKINTLVVATQHHSHAHFVCRGLSANKHIFVEKPLAISLEQLNQIEESYAQAHSILMVGFNRRFSPLITRMKSLLQTIHEPKVFVMTVNAGFIPPDHWTQDLAAGGGRMIGEGCHFIDLMRFLAGKPINNFQVISTAHKTRDNFSVTLQFADGSIGTLHYLANGHKQFSKERLEVFVGGKILALNNFRSLRGYGWKSFRSMKLWRQDKGQTACAQAFANAVRQGNPSPIPFHELTEVAKITINIAQRLNESS